MKLKRIMFEQKMHAMNLTDQEKLKLRDEFKREKIREMRQTRKGLAIDDFIPLKIIGKGAFGQVRLAKKKDTGEVFALKTMVKEVSYKFFHSDCLCALLSSSSSLHEYNNNR